MVDYKKMSNIIKEATVEKNQLLEKMQTIILSTTDSKGIPNSSYAPSVMHGGSFYIFISELSKHTKNLTDQPSNSFMVIEDEKDAANIFARKRLTFKSKARKVERGNSEWDSKIKLLEDKFETIAYLKNMGDFHLFELKPSEGLLVYGFGKAFRLTGPNLDQINHMNDQGHKEKKHG